MSSAAPVQRWGGEFRWWHRVEELRAYGLRWSEIEREAMTRNVLWESSR